jgi:hypothetical protein
MILILILLVWYVVGMILPFYWPIKYKHNMRTEDWISFLKMVPIFGFFGPFSFFASFPI